MSRVVKFARFVLLAGLYIFTRLEINYHFHLLSGPIFFHSMYNKTIIGFGFCDIQNNQGLDKGYQPKPKTLIILDITKTLSNNCL